MFSAAPRSAFTTLRSTSQAAQFAALLKDFYGELVQNGVPDHLASLVRQLDASEVRTEPQQIALVVDADEDSRNLAVALLAETNLRVIDCASAEAAIEIAKTSPDLAFVFTDEILSGSVDGRELACRVQQLRPQARIVLTSAAREPGDLPAGVIRLEKPWRGLDLLVEAGRAERDASPNALAS